jgi:hypothetical protein
VYKSELQASVNSLFTVYMLTVDLLRVSWFGFSLILIFKLLCRWAVEELLGACVT